MVGLAGKGNDHHRSWTGIQINFWPLVHTCFLLPTKSGLVTASGGCYTGNIYPCATTTINHGHQAKKVAPHKI